MGASVARALLEATFASSIAVLIVCVLRKPMRRITGARSAYWLWLFVPATALAVFLPAPSYQNQLFANPLPNFIGATLNDTFATVSYMASSSAELRKRRARNLDAGFGADVGGLGGSTPRVRPDIGKPGSRTGWCSSERLRRSTDGDRSVARAHGRADGL